MTIYIHEGTEHNYGFGNAGYPAGADVRIIPAGLRVEWDRLHAATKTAEGTVCVRLDGLADKIARAIGCSAEYDGAAVVALLQSLAVQ